MFFYRFAFVETFRLSCFDDEETAPLALSRRDQNEMGIEAADDEVTPTVDDAVLPIAPCGQWSFTRTS